MNMYSVLNVLMFMACLEVNAENGEQILKRVKRGQPDFIVAQGE